MNKFTYSLTLLLTFSAITWSSTLFGQNYGRIAQLHSALKKTNNLQHKIDLLNELGQEYYDINDSLHLFAQEALKLSQESAYKKGEIQAYTNLGLYYSGNLRNNAKAELQFKQALQLCRQHQDSACAQTNLKIGASFNLDKKAKVAKKYFLNAYSLLATKPADDTYFKAVYALADIYGRLRIRDSAYYFLDKYKEQVALMENDDHSFRKAEYNILSAIIAGNYFSNYEKQTNDFQKAEKILNAARIEGVKSQEIHRLFIELNYSIAFAQWEKEQGNASRLYYQKLIDYFFANKKDIETSENYHPKLWAAFSFSIRNLISDNKDKEAKQLIIKGISYFEKNGDLYHKAKLLWSIESSYWRYSDYYNAFKYQQEELMAWSKLGNSYWMCINLENTGMIYGRLGNYDKQLSIFHQLLKTAKKKDITDFTLYAYKDLAKTYYYLEKPDSGLIFIAKAIELNRKVDNSFIDMVNQYTKGLLLEQQQKYSKAIEAYTKACDIMKKYDYPMNTYDQVAALSALGRTYIKTKDFTKAYDCSFQSLSQAKKENVKEVMRNDYYNLAELCKQENNKGLAIEYYKQYIQLRDELAGEEAKKAIQRAEIESIKKINEQEKRLLEKDNKIKSFQLQQQKQYLFTISIVMFFVLILLVVIFYGYKQKKRANRLLSLQKRKIEEKNIELQMLNDDLNVKNEEIKTQNEEIQQQKDKLEIQKQNITDSITYAGRIQKAILPSTDIIATSVDEYFVIFKPRDIVSGDFYWFKKTDDILHIIAADCTGHGVPGAFMSMLGLYAIDEIVNSDTAKTPADILNELRRKIKKSLHQTGKEGETQDGMDIAVIKLDTNKKTLQFAGAYNPLLLFSLQNEDDEQNKYKQYTIKGDRMPIGIHPKDKQEFSNHELKIKKGDLLYIYSDGYVDQFGGNDGNKFKTKRFVELIDNNTDKPLNEQKLILETQLKEWQGNYPQVDDILIVGIKVN